MKPTAHSSQTEKRQGPGRKGRSDDANAFFPDPEGGPFRISDDLAEEMAEEFVQAVTSGESQSQEALNADVPEEMGGPFLETRAADEMADGTDASNPADAQREPLPLAIGGLVVSAVFDEPGDDEDTRVDERLDDDELVDQAPNVDVKVDGRALRRRT